MDSLETQKNMHQLNIVVKKLEAESEVLTKKLSKMET